MMEEDYGLTALSLLDEAANEDENPGYAREEMIRRAQVYATLAVVQALDKLRDAGYAHD